MARLGWPLLVLGVLAGLSDARFYIGRYKTAAVAPRVSQARSLPYIVYPGEAGSEALASSTLSRRRWRVEQPPDRLQRLGNIQPATAFGLTNNYGNDPYDGYTLVDKDEVKYVVPPFTPGGRVHVAFQFWIPISLGGFFVTGRELEAALRSPNPTAYITKLFLEHLSANTTAGELLGQVEAPVVERAVNKFLEWVVPHLHRFTGSNINTVNTVTPLHTPSRHRARSINRGTTRNTRRKRRARRSLPSPQQDITRKQITRKGSMTDDAHHPKLFLGSHGESKITKRLRRSVTRANRDTRTGRPRKKRSRTGINKHERRVKRDVSPGVSNGVEHLGWSVRGLKPHPRSRRDERRVQGGSSDGWVTIKGGTSAALNPTAPLMTRGPASSNSVPGQVQNDRLLWDDDQLVLSHNDLRPSVDADHLPSRPRPFSSSRPSFSSRPSPSRPSRPSRPSSGNRPSSAPSSSNDPRPPFHLTSSDGLPSSTTPSPQELDVRNRLSRLDYLFANLHLERESCRRRVLCEVTREKETYAPLSDMIHRETRQVEADSS